MENLHRLIDKLETNLRKNKMFGISLVKYKDNQNIINKIRQILMENYVPMEEIAKLRKEIEMKERELNNLKNNVIENEEIVKIAHQRAQEIEKMAKEEANLLINDAEKYVIRLLENFEEELKKIIASIQNSRKSLETEIQMENNKVGLKKVEKIESNQELKKVNIKLK
ncbi:MAG: hypothetical protein ACK4ZM_02945 [bacterium]